jgi:hypothetical protein
MVHLAAGSKPFHGGQRGIVVFHTFNEGEEVVKPSNKTETRQWTIDPLDGRPRGFAFVWNRFEIPDLPMPMLACVMVTVPANKLIRRAIKSAALAAEARAREALPIPSCEIGQAPALAARAPDFDLEAVGQDVAERAQRQRRASRRSARRLSIPCIRHDRTPNVRPVTPR